MTDFKETKEVFEFGFKMHNSVVEIYADKKVTWTEVLTNSLPLVSSGRKGLDGIAKVPVEFEDATEENKNELKAWVSEKYDIPNNLVETKIELVLNWVIDTVTTAFAIKSVGDKDFDLSEIGNIENVSF